MKIPRIPSSEITPKQVYLSRRDFIKAAGVIAGSVLLSACDISTEESNSSSTINNTQASLAGRQSKHI